MSIHRQKVRVTSRDRYGQRVPVGAVGQFLANFEPVVRQAILMAFEGRSKSPGRDPQWFQAASDIRFVDLSEVRGDTLLHFEAPELGEAAASLYQQQEMWSTRPSPRLTGIDLVGQVIEDVDSSNGDSLRFDAGLLQRLARFQRAFDGGFGEAWIPKGDKGKQVALSHLTIENAQKLNERTPTPRPVRVAGRLDMIWHSRRSFGLQLDDGEEVRGVLKGEAPDLGSLLTKRVLVIGHAVYRPSGKLLRIDAESIEHSEGESQFWSTVPPPMDLVVEAKTLRRPAAAREGVNAFFGIWPGDETEEELLAAVKDLD